MAQPIRFVRLEDDVCKIVNQMAEEHNEKVSDIVDRLLRERLRDKGHAIPDGLGS